MPQSGAHSESTSFKLNCLHQPLSSILAFFTLLVSIWGLPFLLQGKTTLPNRTLLQFHPWRYTVKGTEPGYIPNPVSLEGADSVYVTFPGEQLYNQELKNGRLALWNPNIFCGVPSLGTSLGGILWPTKLLLHRILATAQAHQLEILLMQFASGVGMALFCRSLQRSLPASLLSGSAWALGGYNLAWAEMSIIGEAGASLAFSLWGLNRLAQSGQTKWVLVSGYSLGLLGLSGHPHLAALGWLFCGGWMLLGLYESSQPKRLAALQLTSCVLGLCICSAQIVPLLDWASMAYRPPLSSQVMLANNQMLPHHLLTLFFPQMWGQPILGFHLLPVVSGLEVQEEFWIYSGYAVTLLSLLGMATRTLKTYYLMAVMALSAFIAGGPGYSLLVSLMPGFGSLVPGRTVWLISLSLTILASYGYDLWSQEALPAWWKRLSIGLSAVLVMGLTSWCWSISTRSGWAFGYITRWLKEHGYQCVPGYTDPQGYQQILFDNITKYYDLEGSFFWTSLSLAAISICALTLTRRSGQRDAFLIATLCFDLVWTANRLHGWDDPNWTNSVPEAIRALQNHAGDRIAGLPGCTKPNALSTFGIQTVDGYASLSPLRLQTLLMTGLGRKPVAYSCCRIETWSPGTRRFSEITASRWLVAGPGEPQPDLGEPTLTSQVLIYENPKALALAQLVPNWTAISSPQEGTQLLFNDEFDLHKQAVVEAPVTSEHSQSLGQSLTARLETVDPGHLRVQTSSKVRSLLLVNQSFDPGWSCRIDGSAAPVYPANVAFLGIFIEPGEHRVELAYWPRTLTPCLTIACIAVVLSCGLLYLGNRPSEV